MLVIPALDLRGGQVVRWTQGDPERERVYAADPVAVAAELRRLGASWLHVVDLDAALGKGDNHEAIASIPAPFELGGGIRSQADLEQRLSWGATRVVVGTLAAQQPELVGEWAAEFGPELVVAGVDAREFSVLVSGWREEAGRSAQELLPRLYSYGLRILIYTDVRRDGTLLGIDASFWPELRDLWPGTLIASGGVGSPTDLEVLARVGCDGVIVGKALYEGRLPGIAFNVPGRT